MAHSLAWGGAEPGHVRHHRLGDMFVDERGRVLLVAPADLTDQDDGLGLRIILEPLQRFDEPDPVHRVPAHPDASGLADPSLGELMYDLVGEGARTGDQPDRPGRADLPGDNADVRLARRDHPRTVRADQGDLLP